MPPKIPLSWLQLTREKIRLAVALSGIAFADILMFMQLGFRDALYYSNVRMHTSLKGDIVVINNHSNAVLAMKPLSQVRLNKALELSTVESVHP
ncbi:MAG: ABC transporter, partial [Sphaerospermopsis sp. SIO1G2]|nr:ABC transporter [Sphaerospermopsis sp. SIO1G2]